MSAAAPVVAALRVGAQTLEAEVALIDGIIPAMSATYGIGSQRGNWRIAWLQKAPKKAAE